MTYEQFFYWLTGYAESRSPNALPIYEKMKEVNNGESGGYRFDTRTQQTPPTKPIIETSEEIESFLAGIDNLPVEEESLPVVGKDPIEDASKGQWATGDESELENH